MFEKQLFMGIVVFKCEVLMRCETHFIMLRELEVYVNFS